MTATSVRLPWCGRVGPGYYKDVTEKDIVENTDWLAKNLKPYGFQFVQLDDGFDRGKDGEHYWIENWDKTKFPHGPEWLTRLHKVQGAPRGAVDCS